MEAIETPIRIVKLTTLGCNLADVKQRNLADVNRKGRI
jgi:hypothetical protein